MTRGVKKSDLPTKICLTCGLPFTWRKKWERNWDEVRYCSDRCRSAKGSKAGGGKAGEGKAGEGKGAGRSSDPAKRR